MVLQVGVLFCCKDFLCLEEEPSSLVAESSSDADGKMKSELLFEERLIEDFFL